LSSQVTEHSFSPQTAIFYYETANPVKKKLWELSQRILIRFSLCMQGNRFFFLMCQTFPPFAVGALLAYSLNFVYKFLNNFKIVFARSQQDSVVVSAGYHLEFLAARYALDLQDFSACHRNELVMLGVNNERWFRKLSDLLDVPESVCLGDAKRLSVNTQAVQKRDSVWKPAVNDKT
jgi:hypothetical protein